MSEAVFSSAAIGGDRASPARAVTVISATEPVYWLYSLATENLFASSLDESDTLTVQDVGTQ